MRVGAEEQTNVDARLMNVVLLKQSSCYLDCYLLHFQTVYFHQLCRKYLINVVPPTRIERATRGLGNRCSIQLSYGGVA
jgi:hypothetical protein